MSQSAILVASLFAAFVLFLAARGRLGAYGQALWGAAPAQGGGSSGGSSGGGSTLGQIAGTAKTVGEGAALLGMF